MSNQQQRQQSEYTDSFGYIGRMNLWLTKAGINRNNLDAHGWLHSLGNFFAELSTEMTDKEVENFNKVFVQLNKLVDKSSQDDAISINLYLQIHTFELKLRKVFKDSGLQHKIKEDTTFSIR